MKYPMMPLWVNDLRSCQDYRMMSREARSFYFDLIMECWAQGGSVPDDYKILANLFSDDPRISRRLLAEVRHKFQRSSGEVQKKFFGCSDYLCHKRVTEELEKARNRSEIGRNAANIRHANAPADAMQSISISKSQSLKEKTKQKSAEQLKSENEKIQTVFDHYFKTFEKTKATKLTDSTKKVIKAALNRGHDVESLLTAITHMSLDDWIDRPKYNDLPYAIATIKGIDNVSKWASYVPTKKLTGGHKTGVPEKGKIYGENPTSFE